MTKVKKIKIISAEPYDDNLPFEGRLSDFIRMLDELRNSVPPEFRENTVFEIRSDGGFDGDRAVMEVWYTRAETPEETHMRERAELVSRDAKQQREYEEFLRLKAIFEAKKDPTA